MRIAFITPGLNLAGGNIVTLEFARGLASRGHAVDFVYCAEVRNPIPLTEASQSFGIVNFQDAKHAQYDIVIATFWATAYIATEIPAKKYAYLIQSLENRFASKNDILARRAARQSYFLGLAPIVIATWLSDELFSWTGQSADVVRYGVDRELFHPSSVNSDPSAPFRVLIEGPLEVPLKNTWAAISVAASSDAEEVWLLTNSDEQSVLGVDRIFSRQSRASVAEIMRQCDCLLKLSLVEGQSMTPVEMALCGKTSILSDLEGYHEYLRHGESALIIDEPYEEAATKAINRLRADREALRMLADAAHASVAHWPNWTQATERLETVLHGIRPNVAQLHATSRLHYWRARVQLFGLKTAPLAAQIIIRLFNKVSASLAGRRKSRLSRKDFI